MSKEIKKLKKISGKLQDAYSKLEELEGVAKISINVDKAITLIEARIDKLADEEKDENPEQ